MSGVAASVMFRKWPKKWGGNSHLQPPRGHPQPGNGRKQLIFPYFRLICRKLRQVSRENQSKPACLKGARAHLRPGTRAIVQDIGRHHAKPVQEAELETSLVEIVLADLPAPAIRSASAADTDYADTKTGLDFLFSHRNEASSSSSSAAETVGVVETGTALAFSLMNKSPLAAA